MLRHLKLMLFAWVFMSANAAFAHDKNFTFTFENDLFVKRDYGYTAGLQMAWTSGPAEQYEDIAPRWAGRFTKPHWINNRPDDKVALSAKVIGMMFTPEDLKSPEPPKDDMPYAGIWMFEGSLYSFNEQIADEFYISLGAVGPVTGVENIQKAIHSTTDSKNPAGWDHQLENEVLVKIGISRKWRTGEWNFTDSAWGVDFISFTEAGVGNFESHVDLGGTIRFGKNLQSSFHAASVLPGRDVNPMAGSKDIDFNIFLSVMGRFMANAIYVDGNTFGGRDTDINLKNEQAYIAGGLVWNVRDWGVIVSLARSTQWFEEKNSDQYFGSLSLNYRY